MLSLHLDIDNAMAGLLLYGIDAAACAGRVGENAAAEMENYAKNNRPWTDRTGNARRTMEGVCGWSSDSGLQSVSGDILSVGVEGHMPYSVFLELDYGGKFAILSPTVHHFAPEILRALADGMGNIAGMR